MFDDNSYVAYNIALQSGGGIAGVADSYAFVQLVEIKGGRVENNSATDGDGGGIFVRTFNGPRGAVMLRGAKINVNGVHGVRDATGVVSGGRGGAIAAFACSVTDDNNTEVKHNREGVASLPIGGMFFDPNALSFIGLGTYEDNTVL